MRATRLWNALPNSLKKIECVDSFKKVLIDFLCFFLIFFVVFLLFDNFLFTTFNCTFYCCIFNCNLSDYSIYIFNCDC